MKLNDPCSRQDRLSSKFLQLLEESCSGGERTKAHG